VTIDDLTPAEREEVQMYYVRAWLSRKKRQRYARVRIKRFGMSGQPKGTKPERRPIDGATGQTENGRRMARGRRKSGAHL
jgi:hypothetical protein